MRKSVIMARLLEKEEYVLGFTPQKPIKRDYEQDPKAVEKWLKKDYPKIVKRAIEENA